MAEIPEVYNKVEQESPDIKMLEGLVCPISHGALHYDKKHSELISKNVMTIEEFLCFEKEN